MQRPLGKLTEVDMGVTKDSKERQLTMWSVAPMSMIQEVDEKVDKQNGLPKR